MSLSANKAKVDRPSVWPVFLTAHAVLVQAVEARLAQANLPPLAWYDVLWALERAGDRRMRIAELADHTVLSRSNMTRLLDRLEVAGLIERAQASDDGRGAFAVLTSAGVKERARMWPIYGDAIAALFDAHLTDAEARVLDAALRRALTAARTFS